MNTDQATRQTGFQLIVFYQQLSVFMGVLLLLFYLPSLPLTLATSSCPWGCPKVAARAA